MLNLKRFFICFILILVLLSSTILATDSQDNISVISTEEDTTSSIETIQEDMYIYDTDSYTLSDIVEGNIFASTQKFVTNPRNNGGTVYGNLFLISSEVIIGSDVTYSDSTDKDGDYLIDSINSESVIDGNVYVVSDSFILEAGSEIHGDLYIVTNDLTIERNSVVYGNIFVTASNITLNGQVKGSAYITSENFTMKRYSYIENDLYLNSNEATIRGQICRNAFVTVSGDLTTSSDFRVDQNLSVDWAVNFTYSGKVYGDVSVNVKNLTLQYDDDNICIIRGNLNYATENALEIPEDIVSGEITTSEYVDKSTNKISVTNLMLSFFVLLIYVFGIVFLSRKFATQALEKLSTLNVKNVLVELGIGAASVLVICLTFVILCLSSIGIVLAFFALIAYLFLLGLAIPLLLNKIAELLKFKLNIYVKLLIVTAVFYLISLIPIIGISVTLLAILIGIGQILRTLFKKHN